MPIGTDNQVGESRQLGAAQPTLVTSAVTLKPHERLVWVTLPASGTYTITLPPAASVPIGQLFFVRVKVDNTGGAVVSDGTYTSTTMTALGDFVVLTSDGDAWLELKKLTT